MREYIAVLKLFIRYGHPYRKALVPAIFLMVVVFIFGLAFLLPKADAGSVQAGLTIIAEMLGVLLGVVFIVVVFMIEQGRQAEDLLTTASQKYRYLLTEHVDEINAERKNRSTAKVAISTL